MPVPAALPPSLTLLTPRPSTPLPEANEPRGHVQPVWQPVLLAGTRPDAAHALAVAVAPPGPIRPSTPMSPTGPAPHPPSATSTHQPPWRPDPRYVPSLSSPLRATSYPAPSSQALLALGDARFAYEKDAGRAAYYWLAAHLEGEPEANFRALLTQTLPENPALYLFHLAHLAPNAQLARLSLREAVKRDVELLGALEHLLGCAERHATFAGQHGLLRRRFGALVRGAPARQRRLVDAVQAADWVSGQQVATQLQLDLPHLLAPRCAAFVCSARMAGASSCGRFGGLEPWNPLFAGGEVLRFALDLDAEGHVNAMGALGIGEHRALWATFLEVFCAIAPDFFAPAFARADGPRTSLPAQRVVCGLPWQEALALPLPRRWNEHVAQLRDVAPAPPTGRGSPSVDVPSAVLPSFSMGASPRLSNFVQ